MRFRGPTSHCSSVPGGSGGRRRSIAPPKAGKTGPRWARRGETAVLEARQWVVPLPACGQCGHASKQCSMQQGGIVCTNAVARWVKSFRRWAAHDRPPATGPADADHSSLRWCCMPQQGSATALYEQAPAAPQRGRRTLHPVAPVVKVRLRGPNLSGFCADVLAARGEHGCTCGQEMDFIFLFWLIASVSYGTSIPCL